MACFTAPTFLSTSLFIALFPSTFTLPLAIFPFADVIVSAMSKTVPAVNFLRFGSLPHTNGTSSIAARPRALS